MTIDTAKKLALVVVSGCGTLKKAALQEVLDALLEEIGRLESEAHK